MSFVFFTSEHMQNVGQVPIDINYSYSVHQVLVWPELLLFSKTGIGLIQILVILYTKYWFDTNNNYSLKQVLVGH
jgi:hypothetical protein